MSDIDQEISSRIMTTPMVDSTPPAFRVSWIAWDSAFRATGLRIGDRIVAVNDQPVVRPPAGKALAGSIGQYDEPQRWTAAHAHAGDALKLSVRRRNIGGSGWQTFDFVAELVPQPAYKTSDGRPAVAPGGPDSMSSDGFDDSWGSWYDEKIVPKFTSLLDGGWQQTSFNNLVELRMHQQLKPQVDFLVQHYPGVFSKTVAHDWQTVADMLAGEKIDLTPEDLRFRKAEDEKIQHVKDASHAAFAAFQAGVAAETIPAFPALDPTQADRETVKGKYVVLPQIGNRDWLDNGGRTFFAFGNENDGYYFCEEDGADAQAMLLAAERYRRLVTTSLEETYTIIGRITGQPELKVVNGRGFYGMVVEIAAAMLGDSVFVDVTKRDVSRDNATFAAFTGEAEVDQPMHELPAPNAAPAQVMQALFGALKLGDAKLWKALYADWRVSLLDDGRAMLYLHEDGVPDQYWEYSRETMASKIYGLRLSWIDDPLALTTGKEFEGAPLIEQVDAEIDHIGSNDAGEYRVFKDLHVSRLWQLQRINGQPWRITTLQQI